MSGSVQQQQQPFSLTGRILDLNEHFNGSYMRLQDQASDCGGQISKHLGPWTQRCPCLCPGAGSAGGGLGPALRLAGSTAPVLMGLGVGAEGSCPGRELSSARQSHLRQDVFVLLLLMQRGLRGMIFFLWKLQCLLSSRIICCRYSQTITRFF